MSRLFACLLLLALFATPLAAETGLKKKKPRPYEFGQVVIDKFSTRAGMTPVTFDHWLHRARYTCRLCHVDIGFGMKAGATEMTAADNRAGVYCGACHNGRAISGRPPLFAACNEPLKAENQSRCQRCHTVGKNPEREKAFAAFAAKMPRERFGNGIDWEKAEEQGLVTPENYLEGVSVRRAPLKTQQDFAIKSKVEGMPDIIFSHEKHTVWNGCELCHPDIFLGIKKGATTYSMIELFEGKYCGACHDSVAFPQSDCQRCHAKAVQ